tara:strand:- start:234 stop:680 length:447 start_codon:yes stop_codon:yes gene_type:complete
MIRTILIIFFSIVTGQEINWSDKPNPITAIEIYCDTDGIPIFVDGVQIGVSPIKEAIQVAPGWHQVSYFPPQLSVETESIRQNRIMRDMIKLARQDILVEDGKTVRAVLSYRTIEAEALEYEQKISSGRWIGAGMVFIIISLIIWGIM